MRTLGGKFLVWFIIGGGEFLHVNPAREPNLRH